MNPAVGLAAARVAIGAVAVAAPVLGARLFRLDPEGQPQLGYLTRLFGGREIAYGAATLLASGPTRRNLVLGGVLVDACDAAAAWHAGDTGAVDRRTSVALAVPAHLAVVAGVVGAVAAARR
jgi:hypothetical protein